MQSLVVLCVVAVTLQFASALKVSAQAPRPGQPFIERNVCEGEGCALTRACTLAPVRVFSTEGDTTRISFRLPRGDTVRTLEGHMHHRRVGAVLMLRDTTLRDRIADAEVRVSRGDTIPLLSYSGEGSYFVWLRGGRRVMSAFFDNPREGGSSVGRAGKLLYETAGDWWVKIRDRRGREGWVKAGRDVIDLIGHYGDSCGRAY